MGGLAAAIDLARAGFEVTVVERAAAAGGKLRRLEVDGVGVDAGPTVFTMRWVFESLFADAGRRLNDLLDLSALSVLARHGWSDGGRLDLFADLDQSAEAIGAFAGPGDAAGYRRFAARAAEIHATLADVFMASARPGPLELVRRLGPAKLPALWRTAPFATLWDALGQYFDDQRLRQLFARYATYVGASPFAAPATLMLIADVERRGVWTVRGGMIRLAEAMRDLAIAQGATFRFGVKVEEVLVAGGRCVGVRLADGERIAADVVVFNGDVAALAGGHLGAAVARAVAPTRITDRSQSAVVWCARARADGFPLSHHNVFFGPDYREEFAAVFERRGTPRAPTVYLCAQDRGNQCGLPTGTVESMLLLINASADGDRHVYAEDLAELQRCMLAQLARCGLALEILDARATAPDGFDGLFAGTGGALYGRANHGAMGSFARHGSRSRLPGLYLAGGSVHPGPGVPMATLSGRLAAARVLADLSRRR